VKFSGSVQWIRLKKNATCILCVLYYISAPAQLYAAILCAFQNVTSSVNKRVHQYFLICIFNWQTFQLDVLIISLNTTPGRTKWISEVSKAEIYSLLTTETTFFFPLKERVQGDDSGIVPEAMHDFLSTDFLWILRNPCVYSSNRIVGEHDQWRNLLFGKHLYRQKNRSQNSTRHPVT